MTLKVKRDFVYLTLMVCSISQSLTEARRHHHHHHSHHHKQPNSDDFYSVEKNNPSDTWEMFGEMISSGFRKILLDHHKQTQKIQHKVVFPIPEDVVNDRSYLPDLGFLTDLAFLLLPSGFPASGLVRLSRDVFESEQCVQYVGCEMTKMSRRHKSLDWINDFLQDFPFKGDVADKLRMGSTDAITKIKNRQDSEKEKVPNSNSTQILTDKIPITIPGIAGRKFFKGGEGDDLCTFSCHPIKSLTRGLKILSLFHDLLGTIK